MYLNTADVCVCVCVCTCVCQDCQATILQLLIVWHAPNADFSDPKIVASCEMYLVGSQLVGNHITMATSPLHMLVLPTLELVLFGQHC